MDKTQFYVFSGLFLSGLLVGYLLLSVRLARFERHLAELSGLKVLGERVEQLAQQMDHLRPDRVETLLERIHEDLQRLQDTNEALGQTIQRAASQTVVTAEPAIVMSRPESAAERVRALVEVRMLHLGYSNLRILSDLTMATMEGDFEVQVEAERNQMPCKGRVALRNGSVRDVSMQSAATMFP